MAKNQRTIDNASLNSPHDVQAIEYNPPSGGQKSLIVGPRLLPIQISGGYTTNTTSITVIPYIGAILAIYNNSGTAGSVTTGRTSAITAQAIGVSDSNGNVGVACQPNAWTYLSMGANQYIITNAATLFVYIMEDPTKITAETGPYAQQNVNGILPIS